MFKENKSFWLAFVGIIVLFFLIFSVLRTGFTNNSIRLSGILPFRLFNPSPKLYQPAKTNLDSKLDYEAIITTNFGDFTIDLYEKNAPNTVSNFINLTNSGYYEKTTFYKLVPGLLIQGGSSTTKNEDPNDDIYGGPGYTIEDEINWDSVDYSPDLKASLTKAGYKSITKIASRELIHYSVAMASNGPNTAGGQFFIVIALNSDEGLNKLQGRHTVFGGVTGGYQIFDQIALSNVTNPESKLPRPISEIIINKITINTK